MQSSYHVVTVFAKPGHALGNKAAIFLAERNSSYDEQVRSAIDVSDSNGIETTCFIAHENANEYRVQCFNGQNIIQCCGHGMIAAAETVFNNNHQSEIVINKDIVVTRVSHSKNNYLVALKLTRLISQAKPVPKWANKLFSDNKQYFVPENAAVSESNEGYLLLEFNASITEENFRRMQPDFKRIITNTKRAVVAIYFDKYNQHCYNRYFAPQYGVNEDSATGSVMRFVADYINQQYQVTQFDVSQCSPAGGFMQVACQDDTVAITADASMEAIS